MASNKLNWLVLLVAFLVVFCAGGYFFSVLLHGNGEVEALYRENGESLGIFDHIPPEDEAAAAAVASAALGMDIPFKEEEEPSQADVEKAPSQIVLTDLKDIAGVAPKEASFSQADREDKDTASLLLMTGAEITIPSNQDFSALPEQESKISLLKVPVRYKLIENQEQYKEFKKLARGSYPTVDFSKQMLVVLESANEFPDKVFEIQSVEEKDGKLVVTYRVNIFGLDKKTNTHSVLAVDKTAAEVEMKQVK